MYANMQQILRTYVVLLHSTYINYSYTYLHIYIYIYIQTKTTVKIIVHTHELHVYHIPECGRLISIYVPI